MAYEIPGLMATFISSGNLSAKQYRFVKLGATANAVVACSAPADKVLGVLQNAPSTGGTDAAVVMLSGISKVYKDSTAAALEIDDLVTVSTESGGAKQSTGTISVYVVGYALEAMAAGTTGLVSVFLTHNGYGSSGVT